MRLDPAEVRAIKAAAAYAFGPDAVVRLFGSRLDDWRAGGDIDLHVETASDVDPWAAKGRFEEHLFARIEQQRVDLVVHQRGRPMRGIDLVAMQNGIRL